jgi:outer membrane protein OmpA-like peptidoglycan-associated protein
MPQDNAALNQARSQLQAAQADGQTSRLAAPELQRAVDAVAQADAAFARRDSAESVDHLSYLAAQRVVIAEETRRQRQAEATSATAGLERDRMRLAARTREADAAQRTAAVAQQSAALAQQSAVLAQGRTEAAERQGDAAQREALAARQGTRDAQMRAEVLERQLSDMKARKTERGLVVTIGDVLFDNNRAEMRSGAGRSMDQLVAFMKQYPMRKALVEGFTDSVGSDVDNQNLSDRRAEAVRGALVGRGVAAERVTTQGYGEAYPVSDNDSASGRQANRRVEIVISDDSGSIAAR